MGWISLLLLIGALWLWRRSHRGLSARVAALESEVGALRRGLQSQPAPSAAVVRPGAEALPPAPGGPAGSAPGEPLAPREAALGRSGAASDEVRSGPIAPPPAPGARRPRGPQRPAGFGIEWEHLIGVRGAAVLGGIVLALAGLYFFQYSIEHGLVPPWLRVTGGTLFGLACVAGAEWRARQRYPVLANGLIGGGIVVLYAAFWAAAQLYGLIGPAAAGVLMVAVTGACTALAYRHASLVIALIGLAGGFVTPLLLSSGGNRPIALFAYILLLDGCLLFVAQRRGWPVLALISLVGTICYQALWIGARMQSEQVLIALAVVGVFAVAYAWSLRKLAADARRQWLVTQAGATLLPFLFALYLAASADLGRHFHALGALLALLSAAAAWLARAQRRPWLGRGAAAGVVAVVGVWLFGDALDAALVAEAMAWCFALGAVFHVFAELEHRAPAQSRPGPAAAIASLGLQALTIGAALATREVTLWTWLVGWLGLAALGLRQAAIGPVPRLQVATAGLLGVGWWSFRWWQAGGGVVPPFEIELAAAVGVSSLIQLWALRLRLPAARRSAEWAAAVFAGTFLLSLLPIAQSGVSPLAGLGASLVLAVLLLLCAVRIPSGPLVLGALLLTATLHSAWIFDRRVFADEAATALSGLGLAGAGVLLFSAWPFLVESRLRQERNAWRASALAGVVWFPALRALFESAFGNAWIGSLPIALGAVSLAAAGRALRVYGAGDPRRVSSLAWFLAVALGFLTVAIPLQLEKEWITIGWGLEGLAVLWLWRRLDHTGLKYTGLVLFAAVTVRLVANEAVLGYYPRPDWRIVNWLAYTYLVPAAAMLGGAKLLAEVEVARLRPWEPWARLGARPQAWCAGGCGMAAIAVIFVWLNLAITDWFATGEYLRLDLARAPARDLTTSLAWATYALTLLAVGVRLTSRALRWLSLALVMVTVGKVFLYDLGELEDLYRVASLLGLAASLIVISFAYQRFVFARPGQLAPEEERA